MNDTFKSICNMKEKKYNKTEYLLFTEYFM